MASALHELYALFYSIVYKFSPYLLERMEEFEPPLPASITDVLHATKLCYLATSENHAPHLSLMNFSYMHDEEYGWSCIFYLLQYLNVIYNMRATGSILVMSTRRNTKKYEALVDNPKVAILIHDFDAKRNQESNSGGGTFSITIYGDVTVATGERAEILRSKHLGINPDYEQFIRGEDRAILVIQPNFARLCNINDTVSMWSSKDDIST